MDHGLVPVCGLGAGNLCSRWLDPPRGLRQKLCVQGTVALMGSKLKLGIQFLTISSIVFSNSTGLKEIII